MALIEGYRKTLETTELEARIAALESNNGFILNPIHQMTGLNT